MNLAVAFCADANMEAPLHVAASSLLARLDEACAIHFHFLVPDFGELRKSQLLQTLDLRKRSYQATFLPVPLDSTFAGLRPLHGNMMAYYRLLLPDLVGADRLLYVDSDTICYADVSPLMSLEMDGKAAGFVESGVVSHYPEKRFFASLGLLPDTAAFNSGVMLFDLSEWRKQDWTAQVLQFCRKYPEQLIAADQTALIATFAGEFARIPDKYNQHIYPDKPMKDPTQNPGIYHFLGSPKPWDLGGRLIHPSYNLYRRALATTVIQTHSADLISYSSWDRAYRIRGGYFRTLKNRTLRHLGFPNS